MILQLTQKGDGEIILVAVSAIKFMQITKDNQGTLIFADGFVREVTEPLAAIMSAIGAVKPFQAPLV